MYVYRCRQCQTPILGWPVQPVAGDFFLATLLESGEMISTYADVVCHACNISPPTEIRASEFTREGEPILDPAQRLTKE